MTELELIERERQAEQARLDLAMGVEERNRQGQFSTPNPLARNIMRYVKTLLPSAQAVRFLEPSVGTGSFFSALLAELPADRVQTAVGYEVNQDFVSLARRLWKGTQLDVRLGDFTEQTSPQKKFNLVVANPPYVRHHHLARTDKERLARKLAGLGSGISGLAGLYCYFMLLADTWLEAGAVSAWLVPSEFMDVNYGKAIREYLTERVRLLRIHRFNPTDTQFAKALVSSAVVVFRKDKPGTDATFTYGGTMLEPTTSSTIPLTTLRSTAKWTRLNEVGRTNMEKQSHGPVFGDLFAIKRGLATGSNEFFILTRERAKELGLPKQFLRPILPSPRSLDVDIVEDNPDTVVLDCPLPLTEVQERFPKLWSYLQTGLEKKVNEGYLTSRRSPWYSQEDRPAPPFLCTYMGRSRNGKKPFRFVWNKSQATAHNVYLLLYPKGDLKVALAKSPKLAERVFEALNALDTKSFMGEGRVYGGGLFKMEPKELANIPADFLTRIVGISPRTLFDSLPG